MKSKKEDSEIPTAKGGEKKANLAKDEKIKSFWNNLVDDWLKFRGKPPRNDKSEDT